MDGSYPTHVGDGTDGATNRDGSHDLTTRDGVHLHTAEDGSWEYYDGHGGLQTGGTTSPVLPPRR